jgi:hypothetical protein
MNMDPSLVTYPVIGRRVIMDDAICNRLPNVFWRLFS